MTIASPGRNHHSLDRGELEARSMGAGTRQAATIGLALHRRSDRPVVLIGQRKPRRDVAHALT
jgi:hypothetical protein